jgi:hypothetical protein
VHVASGVAIGERVDVQSIDLGGVALQSRGGRLDDAEEGATVPP